MKNISRSIIAIIIACVYMISCKKSTSPPQLPPITQTGANTFGCKVNGQVWVPYYPCDQVGLGTVEMQYSIGSVYSTNALPIGVALQVGNFKDFKYGPSFFNVALIEANTYIYGIGNIADSLQISFDATTDPSGHSTEYRKYLGVGNSVFLLTKLDTVNKIFAGTFSFTLYSFYGTNNIKDSVVVSDGRFDLKIGSPYYKSCSN
jgi:hypothetical protein